MQPYVELYIRSQHCQRFHLHADAAQQFSFFKSCKQQCFYILFFLSLSSRSNGIVVIVIIIIIINIILHFTNSNLEQKSQTSFHLFFCIDDSSQKLLFQSFHCHSKVDNCCSSADLTSKGKTFQHSSISTKNNANAAAGCLTYLRCVRGISQFCGDVHTKAAHHIAFFISNFNLKHPIKES